METSDSIKTNLLDRYLNGNQERYKRLTENRLAIANKAQVNIAISGVFVGIIFNSIKGILDANVLYQCQINSLVDAMYLFSVSMLISIGVVLRVDNIPASNDFMIIKEELLEFKKTWACCFFKKNKDYSVKDLNKLISKLNENWRVVNEDLEKFNKTKSDWLYLAQVLLALGIITITLFETSLIFI